MAGLSPRTNRLLTALFGALVLIQLGYLLVGLASDAPFYRYVTTRAVAPVRLDGEIYTSNEIIAQEAAERQLSLQGYALYQIAFKSIAALIPAVVAMLIVWRAGRQWFAWFTAFVLLFLGQSSLSEQIVVARLITFEQYGLNDIFWFLILLCFFLFPNGRVVPRRLGWVVIALVIYHFFVQAGTVAAYIAPEFAARAHLPNWGSPLFAAPVLLNFLLVLAGQVYRYRRVSTPAERQQTKWFVFGFALMVALIPVSILAGGRGGFLDDVISVALFTPVPITLTFAILRYRLWDIDVIIRRTLVYAVLTAALSLVYFGSVALLAGIFRSLTGRAMQSQAAIVASTLLMAALFTPLRHRIQDFIDWRFYRRKYNADQVLAALNRTMRDEVDLDRLRNSILAVVEETMQPTQVSLWIKGEKGE